MQLDTFVATSFGQRHMW